MKKLLFSCAALVSFGVAFAQTPSYDLSVEVVQPAASGTITSGQSFTIEVNVNNAGPDAIPAGDTIGVVPLIGGQPFTNQNNQPFVFAPVLNAPIAANGSITFDNDFTVSGGNSGSFNICAELIAVLGVSAGGELDSSNWADCNNVSYNAPTTSIEEFRQLFTEDKSYYANNTFFVDIKTINSSADRLNYELINVGGQSILRGQLPINGNDVNDEISIPAVPNGVYIMRLSDNKNFNSTKKIMITQ